MVKLKKKILYFNQISYFKHDLIIFCVLKLEEEEATLHLIL